MQRILIADDDPDTCAILRQVLSDEGYTVETVSNGRTALKRIATSPPDLLITDLLMPGLTGWSLFARVRRQAPTLPIIIISGSDMGGRHREDSLPDHTVFLRKPLDLDQLLATVERSITGNPSEPDTMPVQNDDEDHEGR